ncbi:uncharacterized protein PV09_03136 [Verruconis gallopava]|uniref:Uncharacterized protein n=1 Tax=Verruconis gallopava TaxID=253628 RepID=A0A0D1YZ25_9PEZI|nr:uncharacterized protein PV09_03136 [Verruconis gallopava]KIW05947.1 hypothetical protein PV09_03136 [Verruconis gallopava]
MPIRRSLKRRRVDDGSGTIAESNDGERSASPLMSLQREVSPPPAKTVAEQRRTALGDEPKDRAKDEGAKERESSSAATKFMPTWTWPAVLATDKPGKVAKAPSESKTGPAETSRSEEQGRPTPRGGQNPRAKLIASPIQLTRIRDLPPSHNVDTVSLRDILGHPLLKECWQFNYLHSIPWILEHFDADVRNLVSLKVVHGFWRNDDGRKQSLQEQADAAVRSGARVQLVAAHMPEMFGTHHTKMMILFRHDDLAMVVIHTANMIEQDWTNLTQAVWRSPWLPLLTHDGGHERDDDDKGEAEAEDEAYEIGTGQRFKADLVRYLKAYESRTRTLVRELRRYDFSSVKAALVASAPSKASLDGVQATKTTAFGWPGLKQILSRIPAGVTAARNTPVVNVQVSSIATLTEKWIHNLQDVLAAHAKPPSADRSTAKPKYHIIFPTAAEIRNSLDGYASGASIHMKLKSAAQQKQLQLLRPMLCHWDGPGHDAGAATGAAREAFRSRAAPHIKTYVRFRDSACSEIDWAMVTSANLSQQAWGATQDKDGLVRISSYELGVVVWPDLFRDDDGGKVMMVPTFGKDTPAHDAARDDVRGVVGFRMPYSLPLVPYRKEEVPWCNSDTHAEPDWMGVVWNTSEGQM